MDCSSRVSPSFGFVSSLASVILDELQIDDHLPSSSALCAKSVADFLQDVDVVRSVTPAVDAPQRHEHRRPPPVVPKVTPRESYHACGS